MAIEEIRSLDDLILPGGPRRPVLWVVMHHFWSPNASQWASDGSALRGIDDYHRRQGWGGIGYHYAVGPDETLWRCRPLNRVGAHTRGRNVGSVGVAYAANFGSRRHDQGQMHDLPLDCSYQLGVDAVAHLVLQLGLTSDSVRFHNEFSQKTCPGDEWALPKGERLMVLEKYREAVHAANAGAALPSGRVVRVKVDDVVLEGLGAVLEDAGENVGVTTVLRAPLSEALGAQLSGGERVPLRQALRQASILIPPRGWHPEQTPPTIYCYTIQESN